MSQVHIKTQELGMKMMEMKDSKKPFMEIWNEVQVYTGQKVSHFTVDLYILDLCMNRLKTIKNNKNKEVFENLLHVWSLLMLKSNENINEDDYPEIEKAIMDYS